MHFRCSSFKVALSSFTVVVAYMGRHLHQRRTTKKRVNIPSALTDANKRKCNMQEQSRAEDPATLK